MAATMDISSQQMDSEKTQNAQDTVPLASKTDNDGQQHYKEKPTLSPDNVSCKLTSRVQCSRKECYKDVSPQQIDSRKIQNAQGCVQLASTSDNDGQHCIKKESILSPDNVSCKLSALLQFARKEFYKDRKIIVRNVPPCSYEEVKEFMGNRAVSNITISKKSRHAIVTLQEGEKAIEIASELNEKHLLNTKVSVSFYPSDRLICVAHLPSGFTESNFEALVSTFGPVEKSFLMRDEFTGESKGYGFVEYCVNREKSMSAREELDWKAVGESIIQCDFISGNQANYSQLNSRCLLVENLPKDFRNDCHLRDMFSLFSSPAYCRILVKDNETSLGIAVVEYTDYQVATRTRHQLDGSRVKGSQISISYCLVGKTAIDIYNRFMSRGVVSASKGVTGNTHKSGLLPNPILLNEALVNSPLMKSLTDTQPHLIPKLQRALKELQTGYTQQLYGTNKQGLLGPAPSMMNPLMNPNLQLGLATMLALQLQSQSDILRQNSPSTSDALHFLTLLQPSMTQKGMSGAKPSLLGDPITAQARILVQNLMSQLHGITEGQGSAGYTWDKKPSSSWEYQNSFTEGSLKNLNLNSLVNLGQIVGAIQQYSQHMTSASPAIPSTYNGTKVRNSLLGDASNYFGSNEAKVGNGSWEKQIHQALKSKLIGEGTGAMEDCKENFLRNLQTLATQYSGSKGFVPSTNANNMACSHNLNVSNGNSLLGNYNNSTSSFLFGQSHNNTNVAHCHNNNIPTFSTNKGGVDFSSSVQGNDVKKFHQKPALLPEPVHSHPAVYNTCQNNNYAHQIAMNTAQKAPPLLSAPLQVSSSQDVSEMVARNTASCAVQKPLPLLSVPFQRSGSQNINDPVSNVTTSGVIQKPPPLLPSPFQMSCSQNDELVKNNVPVSCVQRHPPLLPTVFQGSSSQNLNSLANNMANSSNFSKQQPLLPDPFSSSVEQLSHHGNKTNPADNFTKPQPLLPNPLFHSNSYNNSSAGTGSCSSQPSKVENFKKQQPLLPDPVPQTRSAVCGKVQQQPADGRVFPPDSGEPFTPRMSPTHRATGTVGSKPAGLLATPIGEKRTYRSLLPAPEVSPDGDYVGQHSQGIGGHYADSYLPKRRRNNTCHPHSLFR